MQKFEDAVIPMRLSFDSHTFDRVSFLTGCAALVENCPRVPALVPFDSRIVSFLNDVSKQIMKNPTAKDYSDVVTFGFWIRKASVQQMEAKYSVDNCFRLGRGVAFHIAPSNVPVNFAYSLVAGLVTGNANIVRVPSKDFPQVGIIAEAINNALETNPEMKPYVVLVRYERSKEINDLFSSIADTRIIWGGDNTITELRKSPLPPRSIEITFADRYSIAVIDSDFYLSIRDKDRVAIDFYNDTFFSDQNACTSPRVIVWTGNRKEEAKQLFWAKEHELVKRKYHFQSIQGVNKLASSCLVAAAIEGCHLVNHEDNYIVRVSVPSVSPELMNYKDNSGFFFEYDCGDIMDIKSICDSKRCQTLSYIGKKDLFQSLIKSGVKGIDRIVPVGKTMDFDLIWDGYNLYHSLTRAISFE